MIRYFYDLEKGEALQIRNKCFYLNEMLDNCEVGYNPLSSILTSFSWLLHCASKMACADVACEIVNVAMLVKNCYDNLLNE